MVDNVIPTTTTTTAITDTATNNNTAATTDTTTTTHDFDRDRLTAWEMFRGTFGFNLCGCIDAAKLGDNVRSAVDTALAIYETTREDGDDYCITCLITEFETIARQLSLLSDCDALCVDPDTDTNPDNAADIHWQYLDADTIVRQAVDGGLDEYGEYSGVRDAYHRAIDEIIDCNLAVDWGWQIARLANEYDAVLDLIDAKLNNN